MFPLQDEVRFPDSFEDQKYSWLGWKFWRQFLQRNIPYLQFPQDEECHWLWHSKRRFPELVMPKFIHFSWNGSSRNMRPASARPNGRSSSPSRVRRPTSGGWTRTMTPFTTGFESPINPNNEIKPGMDQTFHKFGKTIQMIKISVILLCFVERWGIIVKNGTISGLFLHSTLSSLDAQSRNNLTIVSTKLLAYLC